MIPHTRVAVVGAGFAGLGLAARLTRRGDTDFVVLERADAVGGTWRDNVYPGVACDIPSALYSFSFRPQPAWSRRFAPGAEIRDYLENTVREEGLGSRILLGTALESARWDAESSCWTLGTSAGPRTADVLVLAAGRLSKPRIPVPTNTARIPVVHSGRWRDDLPVAGARIAVVGTGASAVQLVPELVRRGAEVVLVQRTAPWVVPRGDRPTTDAERHALRDDADGLRDALFAEAEAGLDARLADGPAREALRARALDHLAAQVADPALRAALTPDHEIGCKRVLLSDDFLPAVAGDRVHLVTSPLVGVEGDEVVTEDGGRHAVDAVVLATGFHAARPPYAQLVTGADGTSLAEHWSGGMRSVASTAVAGFPNLFVVNGPNASLGHNSAVHMIESQIGYVLGALDHLRQTGGPLDPSPGAEDAYTAEIDAASRGTVWLSGCDSWYLDPVTGRLALVWPGSAADFRARNGTFDPSPFRTPALR